MQSQGILFVVSGPSGVGKGTICSEFLKRTANIYYSVSLTTRPPREGEVNGREYIFVGKEAFEELIKNGQLLEYTRIYDNYYGTPRKPISEELNKGNDVLLEIEMNGAEQVRNKFCNGVFVFILPPSLEDLSVRLRKRGKDSDEIIKKRLEAAGSEIAKAVDYDYLVVNNVLEEAVQQLSAIMEAEKNRVTRNMDMINSMTDSLR